jgi:heme exporter protein D
MKMAFSLLALVILIYAYTMYAMRQETILEEIDQEIARERGLS